MEEEDEDHMADNTLFVQDVVLKIIRVVSEWRCAAENVSSIWDFFLIAVSTNIISGDFFP